MDESDRCHLGIFFHLSPFLETMKARWGYKVDATYLPESALKVRAHLSELLSWALPEQELSVCCVNPLRLGGTLLQQLVLFNG